MYIKKDGKWLYAYSGCNSMANARKGKEIIILKDTDDSMKECMMYLPIYSELNSVKIGVGGYDGTNIDGSEDFGGCKVGRKQ